MRVLKFDILQICTKAQNLIHAQILIIIIKAAPPNQIANYNTSKIYKINNPQTIVPAENSYLKTRRRTLKCKCRSRLRVNIKENGRDETFDLNGIFKITSASNSVLLCAKLLTQVTELAHVVYSTCTQCIFTT